MVARRTYPWVSIEEPGHSIAIECPWTGYDGAGIPTMWKHHKIGNNYRVSTVGAFKCPSPRCNRIHTFVGPYKRKRYKFLTVVYFASPLLSFLSSETTWFAKFFVAYNKVDIAVRNHYKMCIDLSHCRPLIEFGEVKFGK